MRLTNVIFKNVLRQKTRTALTLLGISIGIATILTLGAVADGLSTSFGGVVNSGEADFVVGQAGSSDMSFSRISEDVLDELAAEEGVEAVEGVNMGITQVGNNPYFIVLGLSESGMDLGGFSLVRGERIYPSGGEIVLGKVASTVLDKDVGDTVEFFGAEYRVAGIYETGEQMQDGGAVLPIAEVQRQTQSEGNLTLAFVKAAEDADIDELTSRIDNGYDGQLVTIKSADELSRIDQGTEIINAATWMISALAIIIGGIGVMNTMIISVFDRIREIGVLRAVGWKRHTIMTMVLGESVVIGLAAVLVGSVLALAVLVPLSQTDVAQAFLKPAYTWELWGRATLVAVLVSILGGLYPAWRAANLSPVEALRYE